MVQNDQENLTLANDIASQPMMFGMAAIIKDCKTNKLDQNLWFQYNNMKQLY